MNEEVTPCIEPVVEGPKPPPPPTHSLIKTNSLKSNEELLPPLPPTELDSYNTPSTDHLHVQESYTLQSELDSLRKENEDLKSEVSRLKVLVQRLQDENLRVLNRNTMLIKADTHNGMPIPEQSAGTTRQSEMVPKGSGTY